MQRRRCGGFGEEVHTSSIVRSRTIIVIFVVWARAFALDGQKPCVGTRIFPPIESSIAIVFYFFLLHQFSPP